MAGTADAPHLLVGGCPVTAANIASGAFDARAAAAAGGGTGIKGVSTGTTILAVSFKGGVVLGADSRVSTGNYISNRASDKITPLFDGSIYLCRSGSAADTQLVADYVRHFTHQHSMERNGDAPDVQTIARVTQQLNYNNKNMNLIAAMIVAGWDEKRGGQVFSLPIGGTMVPVSWAVDGSGSTFIWGFIDAEYKHDMSREEAEAFVTRAISLAMARDGSSGGLIRLVVVDEHGAERKMIAGSALPVHRDELPHQRNE